MHGSARATAVVLRLIRKRAREGSILPRMSPGVRLWVCVTLVLLASAVLSTAHVSGDEFRSYPQFRYVGGLPGNGWAVNSEGDAGFDGAMSQTIPIGYTPSWGSGAVGYHAGQIDGGGLNLTGDDANGTGVLSVGFLPPENAVCFTVAWVDDNFDAAYNLQVQVLKEREERPAVSVGVLDMLNQREEFFGTPPGDSGARSFYVAATKRLGAEENPLHVTVGWGSGRYNNSPFFGACYDAHDRVKVLGEYDGFSFNAGVGAELLGGREREDALTVYVGAAALNRLVMGISYAR